MNRILMQKMKLKMLVIMFVSKILEPHVNNSF